MNDVNLSVCKFSADIVPYMYGELPVAESSVFESHLVGCSECTDEFAAISNARYEVYEWKKLEFEPLVTPQFVIPYGASEETVNTWVDKLRAAFSKSWAVPSLAFAMLAIVSIFAAAFIYLGNDRGVTIAGGDNSNPSPVTLDEIETPRPVPVTVNRDAVTEDPHMTPAVRPVKAAVHSRAESRRAVRPTKLTQQRRVEIKSTSAQNQNAPRLNDFSEDEDTSLRLAELFEDIETSD